MKQEGKMETIEMKAKQGKEAWVKHEEKIGNICHERCKYYTI